MEHIMKLSKNFTLDEFVRSNTALSLGINNKPDGKVVCRLQTLVDNILQPLRNVIGPIIITSGYRSPKLNTAIGGSANSQHVLGFAADFITTETSLTVVAEIIKKDFPFDQLILEKPSSDSPWIHVSYVNPIINRKQVLTYTGKKYKPGLHYER